MCGIAGYYNYNNNKKIDSEKIIRMNESLKHRGPDDNGFYINRDLAIGNVRLSIVDIAGGKQPFFNEDKLSVIVFNGEIYNYKALKKELEESGEKFRTNSDTEVILKSYHKYGFDCIKKFIGCWSFALWDASKKSLFISRDRLGEKPLYYAIKNGTFVFASELKGIFTYGLQKEINTDLIELYLTLSYIPAPYTFYKGINKLEPAHNIIIENGNIRKEKYWKLPYSSEEYMNKNSDSIVEEFKFLLEDSVELQMQCDVPFGAFLSGGLDSSTIVSIMSQKSKSKIKTFTMGYNVDKDESSIAQNTAKYFGTDHYNSIISDSFIEDIVPFISKVYDEPFGDTAAVAFHLISKIAKNNKLKVILTGDGGDEALSGYNIYKSIMLYQKFNKLPNQFVELFISLLTLLKNFTFGSFENRVEQGIRFLSPMKFNTIDFLAYKNSWFPLNGREKTIRNYSNQYHLEDYLTDSLKLVPYKDIFYTTMYYDLMMKLPDQMLVKTDRMSMANSIEVRVPFLDYRIIELLSKVDKSIKLNGLQSKSILRKAFSNQLPIEVLRQSKKGFGMPIKQNIINKYKNNFSGSLNDLINLKELGSISENYQSQERNTHLNWIIIMLNETIK